MSERRCDKSDLSESMCAHCRGNIGEDLPHPGERTKRYDRTPTFPARYWGTCSEDCGDPIEPGDMIVGIEGSSYAHAHCVGE